MWVTRFAAELVSDVNKKYKETSSTNVHILNKQSSKECSVIILIRHLVLRCLHHNILFRFNHIPGKIAAIFNLRRAKMNFLHQPIIFDFKSRRSIKGELNIDGGKHVLALFLNYELFWMNNKTIIEFGFRIIWRIMEISKGVIRLGLRPRRITPSSISIILHKILSLIY